MLGYFKKTTMVMITMMMVLFILIFHFKYVDFNEWQLLKNAHLLF